MVQDTQTLNEAQSEPQYFVDDRIEYDPDPKKLTDEMKEILTRLYGEKFD